MPISIVVNQCLVNLKAKIVPVTLVNTKNYNTWLQQHLLEAKLYNVEYHPWKYKTILDQEENDIKIGFQAFPPPKINAAINQLKTDSEDSKTDNQQEAVTQNLGPGPTLGQNILIYRVKSKGYLYS